MAVQNDPDLESLFREELTERASSLAEGAAAVVDGTLTPEIAGRMVREGHTIKGTGRVMGHEIIARGGEASEVMWRWIQQGDFEPSPMVGRTLAMLASSLVGALGGPGTEVNGALATMRALVTEPERLDELPVPLEDVVASLADIQDDESMATVVELTQPEPTSAAPEDGPETEADAPAPEDAGTEDPAIEPVAEDQEPTLSVVEESTTTDPDPAPQAAAPDSDPTPQAAAPAPAADTAASEADSGPLVYEPGPDGKLQRPTVTVEIIRSAFAGGDEQVAAESPRPQPEDSPSASAPTTELTIDFLYEKGSIFDPEGGPAFGLGGLVGAVESWAAEESVPVNAGRLFRIINEVAALRIDLESLAGQASPILRSADFRALPTAESALEAIETARRAAVDLQEASLGLTAVSLAATTATLPQMMKYLAKKCGKSVELRIEGADTVVDRQMVDRIGEATRQLIVNAVVHGIEYPDDRVKAGKPSTGVVTVRITNDDQYVTVQVTDDGAGIDWSAVREVATATGLVSGDPSTDELRSVLFGPGFSTNPQSSEFTRDGDGLARISQIVEEVFGSIEMDSGPNGSSFTVTLPAQRALQEVRIFRAGDRSWGIPESTVVATLAVSDTHIDVSERGSTVRHDGETIPYSSFSSVAGLEVEGLPSKVLIIRTPSGPLALAVDQVLDVREVATKDLGPLLEGSTVVTGVALLGGDDTVLLVDAGRLAMKFHANEAKPSGPVRTILVVDDSQGVRQVVSGVLAAHGFATIAAGSVADALGVLSRSTVDALVVDFSMPRADGVALIHLVRQRYGGIPIVMLSGVATEEDRARAERAGADAFFDKADFAKGALVERLDDLIETAAAPTT